MYDKMSNDTLAREWRRRMAARSTISALLLSIPVLVAATIGVNAGPGGLVSGFSSFVNGPSGGPAGIGGKAGINGLAPTASVPTVSRAAAPNGGATGGGSSGGRREDRIHGHPVGGGRQQDQRHQGRARSDEPGLERSQGSG
jgi:hypothetical protein